MKKLLLSILFLLFLISPVSAEMIYTMAWVNATATATATTSCTYKKGENGRSRACISDGTTQTAINTTSAKDISYHCDSVTDTNHTASDWDINFMIAPSPTSAFTDAANPYFSVTGLVADAVFAGELTPPRIKWMKLTLDENAAARADVTCTITIYGKSE